jgi:hypothetical protein
MNKVVITQSNYIPWKGYFDLINRANHVVFYDDMQYTKRDWRNRNKIQTANGPQWLSIPVEVKGKYYQSIKDTQISDPEWGIKHWQSIVHNYKKSKYFNDYESVFKPLFINSSETYISQINYRFIHEIMKILSIDTKIHWSSDFLLRQGKSERLLGVCKDLDATHYISGPAAREYLDESVFFNEDVIVEWMDYSDYPEYQQVYKPFEHGVTILDLIFNVGPDAHNYMKSFG